MAFQKGNRANPGGRPKTLGAVQEEARKHVPEVIEKWLHLMRHSEDERVQLQAGDKIYERAYGKAPQAITGEGGGPVQVQGVINLIRNAAK